MDIALYSLISPVHSQDKIDQTLVDYSKVLKEECELEEVNQPAELKDYDLTLVFVKSGGTENQFKEIYEYLSEPILLLSTPLHNSLAASMEILSWTNSQAGNGKIIHGDPKQIANEVKQWVKIKNVLEKISNSRLGVIGEPSDWLIDSHVSADQVKENWGLELVNIKIEELINKAKKINLEEAKKVSQEFITNSAGMVENTTEDVYQAAKVYLALKDMIAKYNLNAVTVRCFDLLTELETTGCLALAWLNNEGIVAGCEGDVPAAFTMMLTHYLTDELPFMANLYQLDQVNNELVFAHCTLATKDIEHYTLRSHFESGIGVGIQGKLPNTEITITKIGGSDLTEYVIKSGEIKKNLNRSNACRSQILVDLNGDSDYFITDPIGNHHIILPGEYHDILERLFSTVNLELNKK